MSDLNSWEDDPAAQEDLSRQTQQMNLNNTPQQPQPGGGAASFRPGANSFQPGAQSFQPGQNFQQYGGYDQSGYQNQNFYQGGQGAQGYGGYPQYGQQGGYNNQYAQGGYNAGGYQQPAYNAAYAQQYPGYSQQPQAASSTAQQPLRQPPTIAKRPADGASSSSEISQLPPRQAPQKF